MISNHPAINELFDRYFSCPDKPFSRQQYLDAVMQLDQMYSRVDEDMDVLMDVINCVLQRYQELEAQIDKFATSKNFEDIRRATESLHSGMEGAATRSKIQVAVDLKLACQAGDYHKTYAAWLKLHTRLAPLLAVLKRFQDAIAGTPESILLAE
jgi:hypothetical protein